MREYFTLKPSDVIQTWFTFLSKFFSLFLGIIFLALWMAFLKRRSKSTRIYHQVWANIDDSISLISASMLDGAPGWSRIQLEAGRSWYCWRRILASKSLKILVFHWIKDYQTSTGEILKIIKICFLLISRKVYHI